MTEVVNFVQKVSARKIIKIIDGKPVEFVPVELGNPTSEGWVLQTVHAPGGKIPTGALLQFPKPAT